MSLSIVASIPSWTFMGAIPHLPPGRGQLTNSWSQIVSPKTGNTWGPPYMISPKGECANAKVLGSTNPQAHGYGSKLNHQETAGFSPCFHLLGKHLVSIFDPHPHSGAGNVPAWNKKWTLEGTSWRWQDENAKVAIRDWPRCQKSSTCQTAQTGATTKVSSPD